MLLSQSPGDWWLVAQKRFELRISSVCNYAFLVKRSAQHCQHSAWPPKKIIMCTKLSFSAAAPLQQTQRSCYHYMSLSIGGGQ